jgi:hypothetical protein
MTKELEVIKELIELVMRINKDCVTLYMLSGDNARWCLQEVFNYAWYNDIRNLMKLAVGMVKSSVVCPMSPFMNKAAMDPAFMSCHTMPQLLKLPLEFNPYDSFLKDQDLFGRIGSLSTCMGNDARVQAKLFLEHQRI